MGNPPQREFEDMVGNKLITDLNINSSDAQCTSIVFGKNIATVRRSTVETKPECIDVEESFVHVLKLLV